MLTFSRLATLALLVLWLIAGNAAAFSLATQGQDQKPAGPPASSKADDQKKTATKKDGNKDTDRLTKERYSTGRNKPGAAAGAAGGPAHPPKSPHPSGKNTKGNEAQSGRSTQQASQPTAKPNSKDQK